MSKVGIASSSQLAADAGARIANLGGNAVDAAVAAVMVSAVAEPGLCSFGGSGALTVWPPGGPPVTIEGAAEMPGRGVPKARLGRGTFDVEMAYGRGTPAMVGPGSVATPGMVAACAAASTRFGRVPWRAVLEPAVEIAGAGFPLSPGAAEFISDTRDSVYSWNVEPIEPLCDAGGKLRPVGDTIFIAHLAESAAAIAHEGPDALYRGDLGRAIADHVYDTGGILTAADLDAYEARCHDALLVDLDDWQLATYPPPSIGGSTLAAMLLLMGPRPRHAWSPDEVEHLIAVQRAVFGYRHTCLDESTDVPAEAQRLVKLARAADLQGIGTCASTVHTSTVDTQGLGCSATMSAGYGSGVMPPDTGIWLNNSLGEVELNRRGLHTWPPGTRLATNTAPTVARRKDGAVLAIGSPGADRITSAILQTLVNFANLGMDLGAAVDHPRAHVERSDGEASYGVAHETGMPVEQIALPKRSFEWPALFFGGVGAVLLGADGQLTVAADPRRSGGTAVGSDDS